MGRVVSNDVSAIQPIIFDPMVQVPLYKSLVALEVAAVKPIPAGATVNIRRYGDMSAQTYTPGTPLSATNQDKISPVLDKLLLNIVKLLTVSFVFNTMILY